MKVKLYLTCILFFFGMNVSFSQFEFKGIITNQSAKVIRGSSVIVSDLTGRMFI